MRGPDRQLAEPLAVFLAGIAAVVIWSAGPVATKLAVAELPPLAVAAGRTCLGGLIALPLAMLLRIPLPREPALIYALAISSLSGFVAFPILFCIAMTTASGTHGVMILALLPIMTGLIADIWDRKLPPPRWWTGCLLALIGEAILLLPQSSTSAGLAEIRGDALALGSTLFLALGYVSGGRLARTGYPAQGATYWGVCFASLVMAPFLPSFFAGPAPSTVSWTAWASLAYLALGVTIAGYVLWYWAMARGGIAKVGLLQFFQPLSGVMLASVLLREPLSLNLLLAACFVIAGVVTASRRRA